LSINFLGLTDESITYRRSIIGGLPAEHHRPSSSTIDAMEMRSVTTECMRCHAPLVVLPATVTEAEPRTGEPAERTDRQKIPTGAYRAWADPDGEFVCPNPNCGAPNQIDALV